MPKLMNAQTDTPIREASDLERAASMMISYIDGNGIFELEGKRVYVEPDRLTDVDFISRFRIPSGVGERA